MTNESGAKKLGFDEGLSDEIVLSLLEDHEGTIWCGTYIEGLFAYKDGAFFHVSSNGDSEPIAEKLFEDQNQRIWIQTIDDGIWLYDHGKNKHITVLNNLVHNDVVDIFEDKYGNIWFATLGGASMYGRVIFEIYDMDLSLSENHITAVFADSRDRIWFGTYGHLLYKYKNDIYVMDQRIGFDEEAMPLSFAEDKYQNIYIGTDNELSYFNGRSIAPVELNQGRRIRIYSLLYTSSDHLWCGTDTGIYI